MKSILPILALTVSGLVPATVMAQSKAEDQAAAILVVARELREAGKNDVAATLEAQARRILAGAKAKAAVPVPSRAPRATKPGAAGVPTVRGPVPGSATSGPASIPSAPRPGGRSVAVPPGRTSAPAPRDVATVPGSRSARNRNLFEAPRTGESVADVSRDTLPSAGDARIDMGRERFRYQPVPTGKDANGRVTWRGLPARNPAMDIRRPVATVPDAAGQSLNDPRPENLHYNRVPKPVVVPSPDLRGTRFAPPANTRLPAGELESRVETLSAEVRAMRELLDRLSQQLAAERKAKKNNR